MKILILVLNRLVNVVNKTFYKKVQYKRCKSLAWPQYYTNQNIYISYFLNRKIFNEGRVNFEKIN